MGFFDPCAPQVRSVNLASEYHFDNYAMDETTSDKQQTEDETIPELPPKTGSTLQRDFVVLAVLVALLYGLTQLTNLDVVGNLQQTFGSGYTLTNHCAFPVVIETETREVARAESAETITFQPPANGEIYLAVGSSDRSRFTIYLPAADIELTGLAFPARSDFYGTDAELIACPQN